jgi:hypothetical protein
MTIKIGDKTYRNIAKIEDHQTRAVMVRLMFNNGQTLDIPVTENDEIIFTMENHAK